MLKKSAITLIVIFSLIFINGCLKQPNYYNHEIKWLMPDKPLTMSVSTQPLQKDEPFTPPMDGIFIDINNAAILIGNIDETNKYIEKLHVLIQTMKNTYGDK
jgi:hypothetical protein